MGNNPNKKRVKKETKEIKRYKKIFYALLIGIAVVSFWRGVWGLSDIYLFPSNQILSLSSSVVIGLLILFSTHKIIRELM